VNAHCEDFMYAVDMAKVVNQSLKCIYLEGTNHCQHLFETDPKSKTPGRGEFEPDESSGTTRLDQALPGPQVTTPWLEGFTIRWRHLTKQPRFCAL